MSTDMPEPAKPMYFRGPAFRDIKRIVTSTKDTTVKSVTGVTENMALGSRDGGPENIWLRCGWMAARYCYWIVDATSLIAASALFAIFMLLPHVAAFALVEVIVITVSGISWSIDTLFLGIRHISNVCGTCHKRFTLPVYICGNCGAKHRDLRPDKYGILHHTCQCGTKLPCSVLDRKSPRYKLHALCPFCERAGRDISVNANRARTLCIPIVGAASSGKSAFITAYAHSIIGAADGRSGRAAAHGLSIRFTDAAKASMYQDMAAGHRSGIVNKTRAASDQESSAFSFSFFIDGTALKPSRQLQLLDIAGETFTSSAEHEQQAQYEHCEGIVLVIDPLAIPAVAARCRDSLKQVDRGSISDTRPEDAWNALHSNLNAFGSKKRRVPIAVVINKIDATPLLAERIGPNAVNRFMLADGQTFSNPFDTMDYLCRQFLFDMDMGDIVGKITQQFEHSRFFAVSAMGHEAGAGVFKPLHVDDVIDWIISVNDPALATAMGAPQFPTTRTPVTPVQPGKFDRVLGVSEYAPRPAPRKPPHAPVPVPQRTPLPTPPSQATAGTGPSPVSTTPARSVPIPQRAAASSTPDRPTRTAQRTATSPASTLKPTRQTVPMPPQGVPTPRMPTPNDDPTHHQYAAQSQHPFGDDAKQPPSPKPQVPPPQQTSTAASPLKPRRVRL